MRLILLFFVLLLADGAFAQGRRPRRPSQDPFLKTQWWLGFRAGTNLAEGVPSTSYTSFSPINYDAARNSKTYDGFSKPGIQASLEFALYVKGFVIGLQPGFATMYYRYSSTYNWNEPADPTTSLEQTFSAEDKIQVFDLPLLVKYEFLSGNVHPYIQLGGYYNLLIDAGKTLQMTGSDQASGSSVPFSGEPLEIGTSALYNTSSAGVMGGLGVVYHGGNVRVLFDVNYRMGLTDMTNPGTRYTNMQLASIGDIQDDLTLRSIWASLSVQFPLKFISKNYEAVN